MKNFAASYSKLLRNATVGWVSCRSVAATVAGHFFSVGPALP